MKGGIDIEIEIHKPNRLKDLLHKIINKLEDLMFSVVQKLPERLMTKKMMNWIENYTDKRLSQLKQQIVRNNWHTSELEKAVSNIHNRKQS